MDNQREQIARILKLERFSPQEKEMIVDEVEQRVGQKPFENLPDWKAEEFQKIMYDDIGHINWWLHENEPGYSEEQEFKDTVDLVAEDGNPDNIRPEKVYATVKWIEKNVPNYEQIIDEVMAEAANEDWAAWLEANR